MGDHRHKDDRGSSYDVRVRREWMWATMAHECVHCERSLDFDGPDKFEVDRIVPETLGGRYTRDNIQMSCRRCNAQRRDNMDWQYDPAIHAVAA